MIGEVLADTDRTCPRIGVTSVSFAGAVSMVGELTADQLRYGRCWGVVSRRVEAEATS